VLGGEGTGDDWKSAKHGLNFFADAEPIIMTREKVMQPQPARQLPQPAAGGSTWRKVAMQPDQDSPRARLEQQLPQYLPQGRHGTRNLQRTSLTS
jgi:hypothetical protein